VVLWAGLGWLAGAGGLLRGVGSGAAPRRGTATPPGE
jgi:hypothetical protein